MQVSKTALIIKFGQIGDVIMAVPAARALYERGYAIHWVCGKAARPLLECYSWIQVIPADDAALLRGTPMQRAVHMAALWRTLAGTTYDICATWYYDRRYMLLTWPVRARRKVSLSRSSRERELLPGRHHTDEFTRILLDRRDSCEEKSTPPVRPDWLPDSPLLAKLGSRRVALVPGGTSNLLRQQILRRWPVESYVEVARRLIERGWEIVLVGGQEDEWTRPYFEGLGTIECIGKLSLPEVVSLFDSCDAVISHDTGPLHMAGLSDTCLLGIFGPTDPATRVPRRPYVTGLWGGEGFACRPCYDGVDFAPCQFNGCMHQVTPAMALRELDKLLTARAEGLESPWRVAFPGDETTEPSFTGVGLSILR